MPSLSGKKFAVINTAGSLADSWFISFYNDLHQGIAEEARRKGLEFDLFDSSLSLDAFHKNKIYRNYFGILGQASTFHPELKSWKNLGEKIPVVNLMLPPPVPTGNYVGNDETKTLMLLGSHLHGEGHRRIGFFGPFGFSYDEERFRAYLAMMKHFRLKVEQDFVPGFDLATGKNNFHGDRLPSVIRVHNDFVLLAAMKGMISGREKPDAVIFSTDSLAFLFWECASDPKLGWNVNVPGDLGIVGIGDRAHLIEPRERRALTTVHQDYQEIGAMGLRVLLDIIRGKRKASGQTVLIPPSLRIRGSSQKRTHSGDKKETFRAEVEKYVSAHLADNAALKKIPAWFEVSPSHFSKRFAAVMGRTFRDYLTEERLLRARFYLEHTDEPIHRIQEWSGYPNHRRFYEKFRARFGTSPQSFRNKIGAEKKNLS